jgi:ribonuclease HI
LDGQRLIQGNGPAPSPYPNSFRSEAYGVLATLRWLHHVFQEAHPVSGITLYHYLDNRSVITRINRATNTIHQWPNQHLLPEHDIITEIVSTMKAMPVKVEMKWVKGHQDDVIPYARLELCAQLNCDADQQANIYARTMSDEEGSRVNPLPHSPSQLILNHKTITGHIKRHIREMATVPRLHEYLQQKYNWSADTFNLVDWHNYAFIIQKYKKQWTTLVKHLHEICPTGKIAHRNNCHLPHKCPACMFESI